MKTVKDNCSAALEHVNRWGSQTSPGDSIGLNAALQMVQSQAHSDGLKSASAYCQDQKDQCQKSCKNDSGPGSGGLPPGVSSFPPGFNMCSKADTQSYTGPLDTQITSPTTGKKCIIDPLVVQLSAPGQPAEPLILSAQWQGILFDILGWSKPGALVKSPISWFLPGSRLGNYFLVLPNEKGEVVDVRQMFGNATPGPDGKVASDGFAALAKYDTNKDGFIDSRDDIFAALRLWADRDGDGIAAASEIFTLRQLNVKSIDLIYDPGFSETDRFGNQVKFKSVVSTDDGQLHLIYDVWFQIGKAPWRAPASVAW